MHSHTIRRWNGEPQGSQWIKATSPESGAPVKVSYFAPPPRVEGCAACGVVARSWRKALHRSSRESGYDRRIVRRSALHAWLSDRLGLTYQALLAITVHHETATLRTIQALELLYVCCHRSFLRAAWFPAAASIEPW